MTWRLVLAAAAMVGATGGTAALQTGRIPSGTATLSGVVIDDHTGRPIRYAEVMLSTTAGASLVSRINADENGRFRLDRIAAGNYVIYLASPLHVRMQYGASRPEGRGRLIEVADGARIDGIIARMIPGAGISGTIVDAAGQPVPHVGVQLSRWGYSPQTGAPALVLANAGYASTDDRGRYRFQSLPPGEYVVACLGRGLQSSSRFPTGPEDVPVQTHAEIEAIRRGTPPPAPPRPGDAQVPTYFPGVTRAPDAERIVVAAGQERSRVDIRLQAAATASVRGRIVLPAGATSTRTILNLFTPGAEPAGAPGFQSMLGPSDRQFTLSGIPAGEYLITASTYLKPDTGAPGAAVDAESHRLFGSLAVRLDGRDVSDLVVEVRPGGSLSGRVQFSGGGPAPSAVASLRIGLSWTSSAHPSMATPTPSLIGSDGRFSFSSVPPGRYVLTVSSSPSLWDVLSAMSAGVDLTDVPVEINGQDVTDVLVTLGNRPTNLSGDVTMPSGEAARDGWVVVFSTNRSTWRPLSRRVFGTQITADGRYTTFAQLPPGEYHVVAMADLERGRWYDPSFLAEIAVGPTVKVTLQEGERQVQPLVISR